MTVARPVLRYHGGKWKLATWIVAQFPPHRIYTEAFGGAASVLLRKPRSYGEVYNDLSEEVVNVFRVLRDPDQARHLEELVRLTPYARAEFRAAARGCGEVQDPVERARRTIFRSFAGFGSASLRPAYQTGFRGNSNRSGTTPAMDWKNYPDQIGAFVARLRGVTIACRPALDVLRSHDGGDTLHYVDPPYVHATRNVRERNLPYAHEMRDEDHRALAAVLRDLRGMVFLSGYRCELYDKLFGDWQRLERPTHADGARPRVECLWLNREAARRRGSLLAFEAAE